LLEKPFPLERDVSKYVEQFDESQIRISCIENKIDVDYKGNKVCIKVLDDKAFTGIEMGPQVVRYRNGFLTSASYRTKQAFTHYLVHFYQNEEYIEDNTLLDMMGISKWGEGVKG
jgi:hypothetical protein